MDQVQVTNPTEHSLCIRIQIWGLVEHTGFRWGMSGTAVGLALFAGSTVYGMFLTSIA